MKNKATWQELDSGVLEKKVLKGYFYLRIETIHELDQTRYFVVVKGWANSKTAEADSLEGAKVKAEKIVFEILGKSLKKDFPIIWKPVDGVEDSYDSYHAKVADGFLYTYVAPYGWPNHPRYAIDIRGYGNAMSHSEANLELAKRKAEDELHSLVRFLLNEA